MSKKYDDVKRDYEHLASLCPIGDMMEIDASVFDLMANPTKKKASELYESAINQWFIDFKKRKPFSNIPPHLYTDPDIFDIAEKYGYSEGLHDYRIDFDS